MNIDSLFSCTLYRHPLLPPTSPPTHLLCPGLGHGGLVWDSDHSHPAAQHPQDVDDIKGLGAAVDLPDGHSAALGGADGAQAEWNPVDLVLCVEGGRWVGGWVVGWVGG